MSSHILTSNYVTCHMIGRLGNQMFQIANAYAQSLRHNRQLVLPRNDTSVSDYYNTVHRKLEFLIDRAPDATPAVHTIHGTYPYSEAIPHPTIPTVFRGYYETEKYFKDYSESVKWLFGPTPEFVSEAHKDYPQLVNGTVAAVIVRRGDFLVFPNRHPVVSAGYIHRAVEMLPKTDSIFVVSDDIPWCQSNLKIPNAVFVSYVTWKALWLLSLCDHFVISNSTFTWWGAYLSKNPNKVVVCPDTWFGPEMTAFDTRDVRPDEWLRVPTKWEAGSIVLK